MSDWNAERYHQISRPQQAWGRRVLERLPLTGDELVLDLGCGTGRMTRGDPASPARRPRGRRRSVRRDDRVGRDVAERARAARHGRPGGRRRAAVPAGLRRGLQRRDLPLDPRSRRALPLDHHGAEARRPAGRAMRRCRQPGRCCAPGPIGCGSTRRSRSISRAGPRRGTTRTSSRRSGGCRRRASSTSTSRSKRRRPRSAARTRSASSSRRCACVITSTRCRRRERKIVPRRAHDGGGGGLARLHARLLAPQYRPRGAPHDTRPTGIDPASSSGRPAGTRRPPAASSCRGCGLPSFLGGVALLWWGIAHRQPIAIVAGVVAAGVAFAVLVVVHARVLDDVERAETARADRRQGLARLARDWTALPEVPVPPELDLDAHPYARDLDVFGHASLTKWLGRPGDDRGRAGGSGNGCSRPPRPTRS